MDPNGEQATTGVILDLLWNCGWKTKKKFKTWISLAMSHLEWVKSQLHSVKLTDASDRVTEWHHIFLPHALLQAEGYDFEGDIFIYQGVSTSWWPVYCMIVWLNPQFMGVSESLNISETQKNNLTSIHHQPPLINSALLSWKLGVFTPIQLISELPTRNSEISPLTMPSHDMLQITVKWWVV